MKKTYIINDQTYTQQPLVIGQVSRLLTAVQGVVIPSFHPLHLLSSLGDRLPSLIACVLVPEGEPPSDATIDRLATEFTPWTLPADTLMEVVTDFLECNPTSTYKRFQATILALAPPTAPDPKSTGAESSAPPSPEATLSAAATSSGE